MQWIEFPIKIAPRSQKTPLSDFLGLLANLTQDRSRDNTREKEVVCGLLSLFFAGPKIHG